MGATTTKRVIMAVTFVIAACVREPIEWEAPRDIDGTIGAMTRLTMDASDTARLVDETPPVVPLPTDACGGSMAVTRATGTEWYAAWFLARSDSSVVLVVARSTDSGATWGAPVIADGRDRGRRGCSRPRPAIHADTMSAYVHAAYFIEPEEGAGVWYTHSMEQGSIWHQTIGILYGEEPVAASIASARDTVLVAYEHPGSGGTRIGVAISRQAGHTFGERLRVVRGSGAVRQPRIALGGGRVALAWMERPVATDTASGRARVRIGRLR